MKIETEKYRSETEHINVSLAWRWETVK